jgi:putative membrane protein
MMYHYGYGMGIGGGLLVALVVVLVAVAVAAAVIAMTRMVGPSPRAADRPIQEDVERILADRYARGELDSEEYERRLYTLRTTRPRP